MFLFMSWREYPIISVSPDNPLTEIHVIQQYPRFHRATARLLRRTQRERGISLRRSGLLALLMFVVPLIQAAPFRLVTGTLDGGGAHSQSARFAVEGTVGQPDAGSAQGSRFRVDGGFWPATGSDTPLADFIFQDSFEN